MLLLKPALGGGQLLALERARPDSAALLRADQPDVFHHPRVLREGRQRHVEWFRQFTYRRGPFTQPLNNRPARWVLKRVKYHV